MIKNATKALSLAIIIIIGFIAIKFEHHTEDICQSLDKIYQTSTIGVQSINESKVLECYDSKISSLSLAIAFISVILTFWAFYIQYDFNKQQKKDISNERTENKLFHLLDVYRDICKSCNIGNLYGKAVFHYMFYEYKAIFYIIENHEKCREFDKYEKNHIVFAYFLNGLTPNALPVCKVNNKNEDEKAKLLSELRDLLYSYKIENGIRYLNDYKGINIKFADGHRPNLIPYIKYINLILNFLNEQELTEDSKNSYLHFLASEMSEHEIGLIYAYNSYIKPFGEDTETNKLFDFMYKELPKDISFKFKFDDQDFFNMRKTC